MTDRRTILAQLAASAAAIPSLALGAQESHIQHAHDSTGCQCERPRNGPYSGYFPNVVVVTHEGRRALFYNDLLRGKTVLVNCMSVANEAVYPVTANLARVQRLLGERAGREVFMYSVTIDPEHDTPRTLAEFADRRGVGPGWLFLTGTPDTIGLLRAPLRRRGRARTRPRPEARLLARPRPLRQRGHRPVGGQSPRRPTRSGSCAGSPGSRRASALRRACPGGAARRPFWLKTHTRNAPAAVRDATAFAWLEEHP
jgi:cytochrome oxidase Cu insertion factor (SCO1/SenC/PrrC family)